METFRAKVSVLGRDRVSSPFGFLMYCLLTEMDAPYRGAAQSLSAGFEAVSCRVFDFVSYSLACALYGIMEVMVGSLRGLGYSIMPMLVSLIGVCFFRLVWIFTVFQLPEFHTVQTVYWSYPISWTLTFFAHLTCFIWAVRCLKRHSPPNLLSNKTPPE